MVEHSYLENLPQELRYKRYAQLLDHDVPCVVVCRGFEPSSEVLRIAGERGIPILGTTTATSDFLSEAIFYLNGQLAPSISIHGVLVDIYGEGVLIMGESGIGKERGGAGADSPRASSGDG